MLNNVMLVSAMQQCQSVISTHVPFLLNLPSTFTSPLPSECPRVPVEVPVLCNSFPLVICFACGVYMFQCCSLDLSHPLLPPLCPESVGFFSFFIWSSMSYLLFCRLTPCLLHHLQISSPTLYVVFSFHL